MAARKLRTKPSSWRFKSATSSKQFTAQDSQTLKVKHQRQSDVHISIGADGSRCGQANGGERGRLLAARRVSQSDHHWNDYPAPFSEDQPTHEKNLIGVNKL